MEENTPNSIDEISQADWENIPESVKRLVAALNGQIEQLVGRVGQLERQYEELKGENQLLLEQLKQNSKNSSKPPSPDRGKGFKPKKKKQGNKKPGAQPGHEGHDRTWYSIEQCQSVEEHYPSECIYCSEPLEGKDREPDRLQSVEIPRVVPQVSEHRFHALPCEQCGGYTRAWDEVIINGSGYGERVVAHVGVLSGQYRQHKRLVQELLDELFGVKISVGSINQLRQESSPAVAQVVQAAHQYVQAPSHVNVDETSFAQGNGDGKNPTERQGWLWVMVRR